MSINTLSMISAICLILVLFLSLIYWKRHDWFKKIDYFFISIRLKTKYMLIANYSEGFDFKYPHGQEVYLAAGESGIIISPIFSLKGKAFIPYSSILNFTVEEKKANKDYDHLIPQKITYINYIYITYLIDGRKDVLNLFSFTNSSFIYFNKYVYLKANFFEHLLENIPSNIYEIK